MLRREKNYPYLFGNDPETAVIQLFKELKDCKEERKRASLLHLLTYIKDPKSIEQYLKLQEDSFFNHTYARAAQWRVDQYNNHPNPWAALTPPEHKNQFRLNCLNILNSDATVDLWLSGGLGDQLEMLARLRPCLTNSNLLPRLEIVIPENAAAAMQPFLETWWPKEMPPWRIDQNRAPVIHPRPYLGMMPLLALMAEQGWLQPPAPVASISQSDQETRGILFCWKSKIDKEEKLWAYLRSIPFSIIQSFYQELIPWAQDNQIKIIDITRYNHIEIQQLSKFENSLYLASDQIKSLNDTVRLLQTSKLIISIDTSLIHVAMWFNRKPLMLSPKFPDGRWISTSKSPSSPIVFSQDFLYDWSQPLEKAMDEIKKTF